MYSGAGLEDVFKITTLYTAFERIFSANYAFKGEYHNFYELVVVAEGALGVAAGSDVLTLQKGQAILHEPMEFHNVWSEGKTTPHVYFFSFQAENMPAHPDGIFKIENLQTVSQLMKSIHHCFTLAEGFKIQRKPVDVGIDWQLAVKNLEIFLLKLLSEETFVQNRREQSTMAKNYAKALHLLENNIHQNLSVEEIAALCNMSAISLQKTFSKFAGNASPAPSARISPFSADLYSSWA